MEDLLVSRLRSYNINVPAKRSTYTKKMSSAIISIIVPVYKTPTVLYIRFLQFLFGHKKRDVVQIVKKDVSKVRKS